jgi:hypothetical protein
MQAAGYKSKAPPLRNFIRQHRSRSSRRALDLLLLLLQDYLQQFPDLHLQNTPICSRRAYRTRKKKPPPAASCKPKRICRGQLPPARRERAVVRWSSTTSRLRSEEREEGGSRGGEREVAEEAREMAAPGEEEEPVTPTARPPTERGGATLARFATAGSIHGGQIRCEELRWRQDSAPASPPPTPILRSSLWIRRRSRGRVRTLLLPPLPACAARLRAREAKCG